MTVTAIEWTDMTWNPVRGCARVSPGCERCYAERQARRFHAPGQLYEGLTVIGRHGPRWSGRARLAPTVLGMPLRLRASRRVFVNSMSDLFHKDISDTEIAAIFGVMAACPQHTFQVLTKRPERMRAWFEWVERREVQGRSLFPDDEPSWRIGQLLAVTLRTLAGIDGQRKGTRASGWEGFDPRRQPWPLPNVWIGVSCEDQQRADERIPLLLECPAAVRFVSAEPLLESIDLHAIQIPDERVGLRFSALQRQHDDRYGSSSRVLDWVICGGESGHRARPCHVEWLRSIVQQCAAASVPCFVKQLGSAYADTVNAIGGARTPLEPEHGAITRLRDRKGGDPMEWPHELRVREYPHGEGTAA